MAWRTADDSWEKNQHNVQADLELKQYQPLEFRFVGRLRYEDRLEPRTFRKGEIRETYVNYSTDMFDVRAGALQEVWGKTDGLRVLDRVNPLNYRDFILESYSSIRIPLWGARISWFLDQQTWDFLVFPDNSQAYIPGAGSAFDLRPPIPPGFSWSEGETAVPDMHPGNWRYGTRFYGVTGGWDYSLNLLHAWSDTPSFRIAGVVEPASILLEPVFMRRSYFGGSFSKPMGKIVVRGEGVYSPHVEVPANPLLFPSGYANVHMVESGLGVDYRSGDLLASVQYFVQWAPSAPQGIFQDSRLDRVTLWVRRDLYRGEWQTEIFLLYGLNDHDGLLRPGVRWKNDIITARVSGDVLFGSSNTILGRFHDQSRLRGEVLLYF